MEQQQAIPAHQGCGPLLHEAPMSLHAVCFPHGFALRPRANWATDSRGLPGKLGPVFLELTSPATASFQFVAVPATPFPEIPTTSACVLPRGRCFRNSPSARWRFRRTEGWRWSWIRMISLTAPNVTVLESSRGNLGPAVECLDSLMQWGYRNDFTGCGSAGGCP